MIGKHEHKFPNIPGSLAGPMLLLCPFQGQDPPSLGSGASPGRRSRLLLLAEGWRRPRKAAPADAEFKQCGALGKEKGGGRWGKENMAGAQ